MRTQKEDNVKRHRENMVIYKARRELETEHSLMALRKNHPTNILILDLQLPEL